MVSHIFGGTDFESEPSSAIWPLLLRPSGADSCLINLLVFLKNYYGLLYEKQTFPKKKAHLPPVLHFRPSLSLNHLFTVELVAKFNSEGANTGWYDRQEVVISQTVRRL